MRSKIKVGFCVLLSVLIIFTYTGCTSNTTSAAKENSQINYDTNESVTISDKTISIAEDTKTEVPNETETIPSHLDENSDEISDEGAIESDAAVEQENISYDGTNTGKGNKLLGKINGNLIYYSQIDPRWKNIMYSNHGDKSQTIGTSGCGPTVAAMLLSSTKGLCTPVFTSNLSVDNGYRTAQNGTAWAYWSFIADYFDFETYKTTTNYSEALKYVKTDKNKDGVSDYLVVVSCGSGLWTSSGHYILWVGNENGKNKIYDPYMYSTKYNTPSRRDAKVHISGKTAIVSEANFKKYSNTKCYWIYSNDYNKKKKKVETTTKVNITTSTTTKKKTMYVDTENKNLNIRKKNSTKSKIVGTVKKRQKVTVTKTKGDWYYIISPQKGWVYKYLSKTKPTVNNEVKYKSKINKTYRLKVATTLYSKSNLTGTQYNYKAQTEVKVIKHISASVDYVQCIKTGRCAYLKVSAYT